MRAARFCQNDYRRTSSVTSMIQNLGWEELQYRREQCKTVMMYRIINNLVDIPAEKYLIHSGTSTRGHETRFLVPYYGIRGSTHKSITSWLSGRFQKVVLDGQASDPVPVLSGVPQGSVLGPVLFLIFINDLPENIRSSVRLFADDCVLYRNIKSPTDCQILQDDLNSLAQWEADWQMKSNVAKCHSMRVTRHPPDKHIQFEYTLHQQRLEQVQSAKYLGITISDDLDWGQHISEIHLRQLTHWVFFGAIWPLHLGTLRKLHTKHWFVLSSNMQHLFGIPIMKLRLDRWRRYRGQLPGGPAGDGETPVASATCLTILSGYSWRPAGSSLP